MTELDDIALPLVTELLGLYGKDADFRSKVDVYDPSGGTVTTSATEDFTAKVTPPEPFKVGYEDTSTTGYSDLETYIEAAGRASYIKTAVRMTLDAVDYNIVQYWPVYSGESIALYRLRLRR